MGRWEPGTALRLRRAALELFARQGYDETSAADIAAAAGVTERTFFRHFADKREVLFGGTDRLVSAIADRIVDAPADASVAALIALALRGAAEDFPDARRPDARLRQSVIDQHAALRERELLKAAAVTAAIRDRLLARGFPEPSATLAAETGHAAFHVAFRQWIAPGETRGFAEIADATLVELRGLLA